MTLLFVKPCSSEVIIDDLGIHGHFAYRVNKASTHITKGSTYLFVGCVVSCERALIAAQNQVTLAHDWVGDSINTVYRLENGKPEVSQIYNLEIEKNRFQYVFAPISANNIDLNGDGGAFFRRVMQLCRIMGNRLDIEDYVHYFEQTWLGRDGRQHLTPRYRHYRYNQETQEWFYEEISSTRDLLLNLQGWYPDQPQFFQP